MKQDRLDVVMHKLDSRSNVSTPLCSVFIRGDLKLLHDSFYTLTYQRSSFLMMHRSVSSKSQASSRPINKDKRWFVSL